jgi:hypothetical protein
MGVTVELQNLGDADLSRELAASIEHALSERPGEWHVSIAGSRARQTWELRVEGPNGFERSYTLAGAAGEHNPEAIRRLILQLVPTGCS